MQIRSARHRSAQRIAALWVGLIALLVAPIFSGCYQRTTAPAVTYDAEEASQLRAELEKIEWE